MKRTLYVLNGDNPKEWAEIPPLGPFESEMKAREAIREDVIEFCDDSIGPGKHEDLAIKYTIVEVVKTLQPVVHVSAKVTLKEEKQ